MSPSATPRIILASGSPRRSSVLRQLGLAFEVAPADVDEAPGAGERPEETVERLARAKAECRTEPGALALGFDTLVSHRGEALGKPGSKEEAKRMILRLAGDRHDVLTGIAAATPDRIVSAVERTRVLFREIHPGEAAAYAGTGEPLDKAGAYGIQGTGAALVQGIEGDFFNVMGFPIQRFLDLLHAFDLRYEYGRITSSRERA